MANLNKAFIKAYDKSRSQPAPEGHAQRVAAAETRRGVREHSSSLPSRPQQRIDEAQSAPAPLTLVPAPAPLVPPAAVIAAATTGAAATKGATVDAGPAAAPAASTPPKPIAIFDPPHPSVRPPFANFAEPPAPAQPVAIAQTPAPAAPSTPAPTVESPSIRVVPPRESVTLEAPPAPTRPVILPIGGAVTDWRPVFEVTNFAWPDITDVLLDIAAAQFRTAALELIEASRRHRKLVAITAAHRGEGCTAVALALAKTLAQENQRVAIVDAHFDAPGLADQLGVVVQHGWEEPLAGEKPLVEALVESLEDRLTVLPLRGPAADDWRLSVARLKASFDELRKHCDLVLIDAGPLGAASDRRRLLSWAAPCRVDRALIVRDLRTTGDSEMAEIEQRLHGCGVAQWNFVENFVAA